MPRYDGGNYVTCTCGSMYNTDKSNLDAEEIKRHCDNCGDHDYTLSERIAYALWMRGGE